MLKNVLSLLLSKFYSKQESGEVAHQAMPSSSSITVSNGGTDSTQSYVAPCDGYLGAEITAEGGNSFINMWARTSTLSIGSPTSYGQTKASIPVSKGDVCYYYLSGGTNASVTFIKSIGGGSSS